MSTERPSVVAPICLIVGALLGLAGSFAPSLALRGLAWGVDGIALIVAAALLAVHFLGRGSQLLAAGFLVFIAGQALVLSGSAMSLEASAPSFAAGAGLWAAALVLISAPHVTPSPVRALGGLAALLLGATALQVFFGRNLTPHYRSRFHSSPILCSFSLCLVGHGGVVPRRAVSGTKTAA